MLSISFYTTCMGRLEHLRQTLPRNMQDNPDSSCEFVILDYNSKDGMNVWAYRKLRRSHMRGIAPAGRLVYAWEKTRTKFDRSHAKNMAARLCSGDILVNMDADSFTGPNMARLLRDQYEQKANRAVHFITGTIACRREDFYEVGGYDEGFVGWGHEDNDLLSRIVHIPGKGNDNVRIQAPKYRRVIMHDNDLRDNNHDEKIAETEVANRLRWRANQANNITRVNPAGWGCGEVEINFSGKMTKLQGSPVFTGKLL